MQGLRQDSRSGWGVEVTDDQLVAAAYRAVDAAEDTDDGMVLIKWDEFIPLRDAVEASRRERPR